MHILLLEDDKTLHESLKAYFELEGFKVTSAFNSDDVYDLSFDNNYDLYIFDVNVPGENGFKILQSLKDSGDKTPTIYITALSDVSSVGEGFNAGADDYIKKPFDPEELVIRIKSKYLKNNTITYKDLTYIPETRTLLQNDTHIYLGEVLSNIFHELIINKNKITLTEQLYEFLEQPSPNALRVNLSKLKTKLGLEIKNVRGVGYILEEL